MRLVGVLPNPEQATTFGAYLQSLGISARVDEAAASVWEIWVRDEDQVSRSRTELERFVANPRASEFIARAPAVATTPRIQAAPRVRGADLAVAQHYPIVTWD